MKIRNFIADDSGAVAVDWVVLTGALVGLGLATAAVVSGGVQDLGGETQTALGVMDVNVGFFGAAAASALQSVWGTLPMLSSFADQQEREEWVASRGLTQANVQAYYNGLYAKASSGDPLAIDDLGALEAYAQANGLTFNTNGNQTYAQLHATYTAANP
ncbi:hypothetical protein [Roseicyclus persicicus]|uniref:Uncharacterized protein n=1 Tax=Roseicyclus persicicus TaxID=2650661 RepID=A0A7X6GXY1_9RHOB|nr:hypothetical protein [Roseibacterium persicicum]NKX43177.1 hypothetical protein [Roseibacterium persicicum]